MRKPKNNIFSELYFDQYEVSVNAKNIRYFEVEEHPLIKVNSLLIIIFKIFVASCRVAGVGWLSWTAIESLRAFGERVFANFRDKHIVFYNCRKTGHLWLSKDLHIQRHVPLNTLFDV